ncbi:MAG: ATP-binding protein [Nitrospirota bacterium]
MSSDQADKITGSEDSNELYAEQVTLLFKNSNIAFIANFINSAALSLVLRNTVSHRVLIAWFVSIASITLVRYIHLRRFLMTSPGPERIRRSGTSFIGGVGLSGMVWGSAGIFLFPADSMIHQAFLTFVLGGMTVGAAVAYAVIMRAYLAYMVPSMAPILVRFLLADDEVHLAMGGMSLLFVLLITVIAVRVNRMTISSLRLRFDKSSLVSYLSSAKDDLENLNAKLLQEIAERKKAEEELDLHRKNLEFLVKDRTEELSAANRDLHQEITERKKVEEQLQEAHNRLLTILDGIDALIYVADMETYQLLFINKYGRDIWGDVQGGTCWKVLQTGMEGPCGFCTDKYLLDSTGRPGEPYAWEFQNTFTGHWYYIIDRAVRWIDGRLVRLEVASDITERKSLEEERQRSHKLESVGILAGGIAHDFNNLLTAILNNIHIAKRNIDRSGTAYSRLEQSEKVVARASDLTRQLLTFSKGGAPVKHSTSISEIIRESAAFTLRGSAVRCDFDMIDDLWPVEVDAGQISQVFQNLIINADQAMSEGGIIRIAAQNVIVPAKTELPLEEGQYVKITIRDEGSGIPEEDLKNIFDPYFTTKEMGRGLGLTIVFSIIKNHKGHISVESEPGRGATFIIHLPAAEGKPPSMLSFGEEPLSGEGKILIMDDDDMVRISIGEIMSAIGYKVEQARDGQAAVDLYKKAADSAEPFNAVILDLTVPGGMGGEEAIKILRTIDPDVKAIVSSGYADNHVMANFREYGFSGVVTKPYRPEDLNALLSRLLNRE